MSTSTAHPSTQSMDSILAEARLINSDIGRHSVKCNFSTRLSGRFYQNSSLERNTARKSKLLEMQARKRRLEHELHAEEQRVLLLEKRLKETEDCRENAHELIVVINRGVVAFQACARRNRAVERYAVMKHQARMKVLVAVFLQSCYRGWKTRVLVDSIRQEMQKRLRNQCAIAIQKQYRRLIQRKQYIDLLSRNRTMSNQSASAIQAMLRGKLTRRKYLAEMARRESAVVNIQRVFRGKLGRHEFCRFRQLWLEKQKKTKRVPLHMRRYSTYGNRSPRKMQKKLVMTRRRSSVEDMSQLLKMKMSNEQDENDSVATTLTSLTNATDRSSRRRIPPPRGKFSDTNRTNKTSWPSTHHVLGSVSKSNVRADAKTKPAAGGSVASDTNTSESSTFRNTKRKTQQSVHSHKSTCERRKSLHNGANKERTSVLTFDNSPRDKQNDFIPTLVSTDSTTQHANDDQQDNSTTQRYDEAAVVDPVLDIPPREKMSTPLIISKEASLLVEEVLGKTIITHSIAHSTFDDDFSEHEDDLI